MNTPILDFIQKYNSLGTVRMHMPGHKGQPFLGCENLDITEIKGADSLYEAEGIIAASERNAAKLFGSARTLYSTEGSSQCIRAMVHMAVSRVERDHRPWILAGRNAHKAFLYALALCDTDVTWLTGREEESLCSCDISAAQVEKALSEAETPPAAVYITSPDYLGQQLPVLEIARVCHSHSVPLLVDNAHGAYLRFLPKSRHPMDLGADMCCDSAHKTLPVLTGGAYLHISVNAPAEFARQTKSSMALFGSTSPSYLILASLDLCNSYLERDYREKLQEKVRQVSSTAEALRSRGWELVGTEPLKITVRCPEDLSGNQLADRLRRGGLECEYADSEFAVFMISAETGQGELDTLLKLMGKNDSGVRPPLKLRKSAPKQLMTVRQALFSPQEFIPVSQASGRICAAPTVSCPPAIPIAVSGERIDEASVELFKHYGVEQIAVVKQRDGDADKF